MRVRVHSCAPEGAAADGGERSSLPVALRMPFARRDGTPVPLYRAVDRATHEEGDAGWEEAAGDEVLVVGAGGAAAAAAAGPWYVGADAAVTGAEAAGGRADDEEGYEAPAPAARYVVGSVVVGADGGRTLHIWPMRTQRPINVLEAHEGAARPAPGRADASVEERYQAREELVNTFGSKRSRANLAEAKRRKVQADEIGAGTAEALIAVTRDAVTVEDVKRDALAARIRRLPLGARLNLAAETGADAYPIGELVPRELWEVLDEEADALLAFARDPGGGAREQPRLAKPMMSVALRIFGGGGQGEGGGAAARLKARALVLASNMMSLLVVPQKKLLADAATSPIATIASRLGVKSSVVLVYLLDRYTEMKVVRAAAPGPGDVDAAAGADDAAPAQMFEYSRDEERKDQLLMYVIALLLACQDYRNCDLLDLSKEARRALPQVVKLAKQLGCDVVKPAALPGGGQTAPKPQHPNRGAATAVSLLFEKADGKATLADKLPEVHLRGPRRRR